MGTLSGQKFDQTKYNQVKFNMLKNLKKLISKYGPDAEKVVHGRALKTALNSTNMKENKIREMIHQALSEKQSKPDFLDLDKDNNTTEPMKKAAKDAAIKKAKGTITENKVEALMELRNILDELQVLGDQARDIIAQNFPSYLSKGEAYGAFDMGYSENRYDTTLASIVDEIEEYGEEEDEDEDMMQEDMDLGHQDNKPDILKARGVKLDEANLGHNEIYSIEPEGRFWIVTWSTMDGKKEKVFQSEDEARKFASTLNEDLDLGHTDNEPHMLKADLYKIGKYAMELYQIMDDLKNTVQEIDFPHWWQAKIIRAASMVSSAKHYLEFELKEPQVDAMVGAASSEDVIDEKLTAKTPMKKYIKDFAKSDAPQFKGKSKEKKRQMAVAAKLSAENPTDAPMMEGEIDKADILSGELYKLKGKIQDAFFDKIRKFINMGSYEDAEYLLNRVKGQMKEKAVAAKLSTENPTEGLAEIILNKLKNR